MPPQTLTSCQHFAKPWPQPVPTPSSPPNPPTSPPPGPPPSPPLGQSLTSPPAGLCWSTVVLKHHTPSGTHYDWMIDPSPHFAATAATCAHIHTQYQHNPPPLWTARLPVPPWQWLSAQRLKLTPLAPHRRIYLTYQGAVSNQRGHVTRVDQGHLILATTATSSTLPALLKPQSGHLCGQLSLRTCRAHFEAHWVYPPHPIDHTTAPAASHQPQHLPQPTGQLVLKSMPY